MTFNVQLYERVNGDKSIIAAFIQKYQPDILCRFDDVKYLNLINVRKNELKLLVDKYHPDLIVGDFNAETDVNFSKNILKNYDIYKNATQSKREKQFLDYYMSASNYLKSLNFKPAYTEQQVKQTSVFGGVPDWIWTKVGAEDVINFQIGDALSENLSDHNAVMVTFKIKS
ncbi:unnamed protein product [Didymodactylos carnosus]|uniref:Endonuclease/exonuclease/phosphatase domain-containing protein n=1 Tax=Didymodactylos carnosus TaxID=1234261 RepID=A0A813VLX7_9BILA|nr:unnamed protein product [Didymodactylos carnosus]CAF0840550.1 unnamed protein product [Didymodactylos carnosus]CAF3508564.1 unnamed protein product [Didymodactylos carnosus]CAF3627910.1 unnamed protein product [Didymodactylos carnosus]